MNSCYLYGAKQNHDCQSWWNVWVNEAGRSRYSLKVLHQNRRHRLTKEWLFLKEALVLFYFEVEELDTKQMRRKICLLVVNSKSQQQHCQVHIALCPLKAMEGKVLLDRHVIYSCHHILRRGATYIWDDLKDVLPL